MYVHEDEPDKFDGESSLFGDNPYTGVSIKEAGAHEVLISITQKGERLWYDFDLLKSECTFTIYRVGKLKTLETVENDILSSTPKSNVTLHGTTLSDKPLVESSADDIIRLTQPAIYHDGDSVQQTFVCQQPGNYVLQWRHSTSHTASPFDFISGSHKTKIMYQCQRQSPSGLPTDMSPNGHLPGEQRSTLTLS